MVSTLNAPQREAVKYLDGPLLVLAGAGSGKTRVSTQKIAHLIQQRGFKAEQIAAITFTNKAAKEMRERAKQLLPGQSLESLSVSTFHALGARILRQEAKTLALKPRFSIFDAADSSAVLAELAKEADKARLKALQWRISGWKNALVEPNEALSLAEDELGLAAARLYADYEKALRAYQAVDFDDLIRLPVRLFESDADVLLHAVTDALLGAAGLGDIGRHFPDSDARFKDADSRKLLRETARLIGDAGYRVVNVDATVIARAPRMAPHVAAMAANIATDLGIAPGDVNIKAKTTEGLGFTGRGEGIAAQAVALIERAG